MGQALDIGNALAEDFADAFAVTPPALGIAVRVGNRDDTYFNFLAERLLKEETGVY